MNPNLLLLWTCLLLGVCLGRARVFPKGASRAFNRMVIWVSLPSLVLIQIPKLLRTMALDWGLLIPASMAWLLFGLSVLTFGTLARKRGWAVEDTGALVLTAGLANTSFVGFPLLESILGHEAIPVALVVDLAGSFLTLSTLGLLYATINSPIREGQVTWQSTLRRVVTFPPFVAVAVSLVAARLGYTPAGALAEVLGKLAATLVPLALLAVGLELRPSPRLLARRYRSLSLGLGFKLLVAPAALLLLYRFGFGSQAFATRVTVLEAAMAPMITSGVIAEELGFNAELSSLMIGVGIPLSLFTVPMWNAVLSTLGY